ncbi:uncharacterized protein M6B38_129790 [Iris pallida]|uniref:BRCT domain-containing protein n=1 Tax=Iris pallida TaxID=29817 RepID=A0AAX6G5T1_IRIPA|nr:uncharacterized protein M6B38_129790 [Iris pallida]
MPLGDSNQLVGLRGAEKSCLPARAFEDGKSLSNSWQLPLQSSRKELRSSGSLFSSECIYIDSDISAELKKKVVDAATREGATFLEHWFIGCPASHVVCEGPSIQRYMGHTNNLVTPLWILKTVKESSLQRLVHLSSDLARQVVMLLGNAQTVLYGPDANGENVYQIGIRSRKSLQNRKGEDTLEERQKTVNIAKLSVRSRRYHNMQSCRMPILPITPTNLLDSICWSVSDPTSSACIYTESSGPEDASEQHNTEFFDARGDGRDSDLSFDNLSRTLRESEKREVVFKNPFLTVLFPIDRFGELGPTSRTFFSSGGFSCLQLLDYIYNFYQENMSAEEVEVAIHTDSKHADRLRSIYASKESVDQGFVLYKRIEFLGSRRSFEALKRVSGNNSGNVYQLLIRAYVWSL